MTLLLLASLLASRTTFAEPSQPRRPVAVIAGVQAAETLALGARAYARYCSGCHGEKGDGKGPASEQLYPKPRDFTRGLYKFRTTPWGSLPTDDDIYRTITTGVYGTSMPSWALVPEVERRALVQYVKSFSPQFEDPDLAEPPMPVPYPPAELKDPENVTLGRTTFRIIGCQQCHGPSGGGDGPSSGEMKDDWGEPIRVTNFQRGILRGGRTPRDIYRSIATGLSGTPMPNFGASLAPEKIWAIVGYIRYLIKNQGDPKSNELVEECRVWDTCDTASESATESETIARAKGKK